MFNKRVKFGLKIPNSLAKMPENANVRFGDGGHFEHIMVVALNMA